MCLGKKEKRKRWRNIGMQGKRRKGRLFMGVFVCLLWQFNFGGGLWLDVDY